MPDYGSADVARALRMVRTAALRWPETSERVSHGGPAFFIEEHHEASFACNEERRATVADPLRCLRPAQRLGSDHSQRPSDIGAPIVRHRSIQRNETT